MLARLFLSLLLVLPGVLTTPGLSVSTDLLRGCMGTATASAATPMDACCPLCEPDTCPCIDSTPSVPVDSDAVPEYTVDHRPLAVEPTGERVRPVVTEAVSPAFPPLAASRPLGLHAGRESLTLKCVWQT